MIDLEKDLGPRPVVGIAIDGWLTAAEPLETLDDWIDEVRWQVNLYWSDRRHHDRDGWLAHEAGSAECLALGHKPDAEGSWQSDPDHHPWGWDCEPLCPATKYDDACTVCEGPVDECEWQPFDPSALWKAVSA